LISAPAWRWGRDELSDWRILWNGIVAGSVFFRNQNLKDQRRSAYGVKNRLRSHVRLYLLDEMVFVQFQQKHSNYMLCIGSKAEVDKADERQILDMVKQAVAMAKYRSVEAVPHSTH